MEVKEIMEIDATYTPDTLYDENDTIFEGEDSDFGEEWTESSVDEGIGTDDTMNMYLREKRRDY